MTSAHPTATGRRAPPAQDDGPGDLVRRAAEGDRRAWESLVATYSGMVWTVSRAGGLGEADAAEAAQTVWLRLVEHLGRLEQPDRVAAWLVTTTRREAQRVRERARREMLAAEMDETMPPSADRSLDQTLRAERDRELWRSIDALPERCRALLLLALSDPSPSYRRMADALDVPIGSIGPSRARCMAHLSRILRRRGINENEGGSV